MDSEIILSDRDESDEDSIIPGLSGIEPNRSLKGKNYQSVLSRLLSSLWKRS